MKRTFYVILSVIIISTLFISSCSKRNVRILLSEQEAYEAVVDLHQRRRFSRFFETAHFFLSDYPASRRAPEIQFLIAETHFNRREYEEAIAAYQRIIDRYTESEYVIESYYKIGLAFYNQRRIPQRDQEATRRALFYFLRVSRLAPNRRSDVQPFIEECRRLLAMKEYYIADFYHKRREFAISNSILKKAIEEYADTSAAPYLYYLKAMNYFRLNERDKVMLNMRTARNASPDEYITKRLRRLESRLMKQQ